LVKYTRIAFHPQAFTDSIKEYGQLIWGIHPQCFNSNFPKYQKTDAIAIASPMDWFTYRAQVKLCVARWLTPETRDGNELYGKQTGIVLRYGDTDIFTSAGINAILAFKGLIEVIGAKIVGYVYGKGNKPGEIRDQPELMERAINLGEQLASSSIS